MRIQQGINAWRYSREFEDAALEFARGHMSDMVRGWLASLYIVGEVMVDQVEDWTTGVLRYDTFVGLPLVQALRAWAISPGGRIAMVPLIETWL